MPSSLQAVPLSEKRPFNFAAASAILPEPVALLRLVGHQSMGSMPASLYKAKPLEGVQALARCVREFSARHG